MTVTLKFEENVSLAVKLLMGVNSAKGYKIIASAIGEETRRHFVEREGMPNSKGWPKQHFFDKARRQTHVSSTSSDATVTVSLVGFATHFLGKPEVIRPVNSQFLTIPARAEAYGRRAREFNDLVFAIVPNESGRMQPALIQAQQTVFGFGRKKKGGIRDVKNVNEVGGAVFFWLARKVKTKPHPEAFPSDDKLREVAVSELQSYVESL